MTDRTQSEAGSTHIIRYALELGLLWIDGDGRDKVREALAALDALEAKLASIGAGGVQALSAAPAGWRELAAKVMDALADAQDTTNSQYPEHVRCYPSWERHARWLRWHADMFRSGNPVGNGAGNLDVLAALAASPTPPAEQQAAYKAAPGEQFDSEGFRAWVRKNLPDDTIIGSSAWWADHLTTWAQRFVKAAPQQEVSQDTMYLLRRLLSNQHTLTGPEFRAELEKIVGEAYQQEAQEPATVPRFNCWSTNEGDSWFDHPADSQAIYDCLGNDAKVGDEYELTAGWKSVTARYRITEVVGDGEEYEVECISHPQGKTAPQPAPAPLSDDLVQKTWALLDELEKLRGADRYDEDWVALNKRDDELRAALAAQGDTP